MEEPKTILITGASSGIGAAIAERLAADGHQVFGTTRDLARLKTDQSPRDKGIDFVELDVESDESVHSCVEAILTKTGRVDVLINNAGWGTFGPVEELPLNVAQSLFNTTVFGALRMAQAVLPGMRARQQGLIISMSSIAARAIIPFQAHYSAAKAALEYLSIGLRQETRTFGIKVVIVEPGDINTRFNDVTQFAPQEDSPYKELKAPVWNTVVNNLNQAPGPAVVAETIARIVRAPRPKTIYTTGEWLHRITPTVFRFFPHGAREFAMRQFYTLKSPRRGRL